MEKWKTIVGYEGLYEVNEHGIVRSYHHSKKPKILQTYWRSKDKIPSYGLYDKHGKRTEVYQETLRETYFGKQYGKPSELQIEDLLDNSF